MIIDIMMIDFQIIISNTNTTDLVLAKIIKYKANLII